MKTLVALSALLLTSISIFAQRQTGVDSDGRPVAWEVKVSGSSVSRLNVGTKAPHVAPPSSAVFATERRAFQLINEIRRDKGLAPLTWKEDVANIARVHSQRMAEFNFFNHRDNDGMLVNDRADMFGIHNWRAIGENIAFNRGYSDPVAMAIENWMGSRRHRENLLNQDWSDSAIGLALAADGSYYFTQVFLLRK